MSRSYTDKVNDYYKIKGYLEGLEASRINENYILEDALEDLRIVEDELIEYMLMVLPVEFGAIVRRSVGKDTYIRKRAVEEVLRMEVLKIKIL